MWRKGDTGTTQESQRGAGWRAEAWRKARKPLEREEREMARERATESKPKASHSSSSEMSCVGVWSTDLVVFPLGFS